MDVALLLHILFPLFTLTHMVQGVLLSLEMGVVLLKQLSRVSGHVEDWFVVEDVFDVALAEIDWQAPFVHSAVHYE